MKRGKGSYLNEKARFRMRVGELIHSDIQRFYKQAEVVGSLKILDFTIIGKADIIDGDKIIELKTYDRKDKELPNRPEYDHICQVNLYMEIFNKRISEIWYINHWLGLEKCFEIEYDKNLIHDIIAYTAILHQHLKSNVEPPHRFGCLCRNKGGGRDRN